MTSHTGKRGIGKLRILLFYHLYFTSSRISFSNSAGTRISTGVDSFMEAILSIKEAAGIFKVVNSPSLKTITAVNCAFNICRKIAVSFEDSPTSYFQVTCLHLCPNTSKTEDAVSSSPVHE